MSFNNEKYVLTKHKDSIEAILEVIAADKKRFHLLS